jgi:hypothetical protein
LLVVVVPGVLLTAMNGYRLHPVSAVGVRGSLIETTAFSGGVALLIRTDTGDCYVALVRRFGPLWRSLGRSECGWADRSHPFQYTGWGTSLKAGNEQHFTMAIGGIFSDQRIATIRMEGQHEQAVSPETGYLFVYESYNVTGFPPTQALAADGSILYTMNMGSGWEWVLPPTEPPLPQRVTNQVELAEWESLGILAADPRSSVWQNGEVQVDGKWQPFYVWADGGEGLCGMGTAVTDQWTPWYQVYPCPEPLGVLRITGIDATGRLVSFVAPDGRAGSFDLATLTWHMDKK